MKSQDATARKVPNSLNLTLIIDGETEALRIREQFVITSLYDQHQSKFSAVGILRRAVA